MLLTKHRTISEDVNLVHLIDSNWKSYFYEKVYIAKKKKGGGFCLNVNLSFIFWTLCYSSTVFKICKINCIYNLSQPLVKINYVLCLKFFLPS